MIKPSKVVFISDELELKTKKFLSKYNSIYET